MHTHSTLQQLEWFSASRSPESEFETGYVLQNGIFNYRLVRKREKLGNCPVWGRGEGTESEAETEREGGGRGGGGGSNGLQDKPTFLKTPGVVITRAKQLNLHTGANMASLSSLWKKKKKTERERKKKLKNQGLPPEHLSDDTTVSPQTLMLFSRGRYEPRLH